MGCICDWERAWECDERREDVDFDEDEAEEEPAAGGRAGERELRAGEGVARRGNADSLSNAYKNKRTHKAQSLCNTKEVYTCIGPIDKDTWSKRIPQGPGQ